MTDPGKGEPNPDLEHPLQILHTELFGFPMTQSWQAYERLTALVLAVLGWTQIKQQSHERPEGRRALQRLDVVAQHPSGEQRRLIVQCKRYGETVGKEEIDTLIGVGKQLGDVDLAMVTTEGFTSGARDAAVDENVAMVLLRPYDEASESTHFVRVVEITLNIMSPGAVTNFQIEHGAVEGLAPDGSIQANTLDPLEMDDGTTGESLAYFIEQGSAREPGEFDRRFELPERRWLRYSDTGRVLVDAISWHERTDVHTDVIRIEGKGEPKLVLKQLDENLEMSSGRLVVDKDLFAWDLDVENNVVPRGQILVVTDESTAE